MAQNSEKQNLIRTVVQRRKFLGTWPLFQGARRKEEAKLAAMSIEDLKGHEFVSEWSVRVHSNPLFHKIVNAIRRGRMDPRWVPFVAVLKAAARAKSDRISSRSLDTLIGQTTRSDVLLNLVRTALWIVSHDSGRDRGDDRYVDQLFDPLASFFDHYGCRDLLLRHPMAYTWGEADNIKALMQLYMDSPNEATLESRLGGLSMMREIGANESPEPVLRYSNRMRELFGDEESFNNLSLVDYGKYFVRLLLQGEKGQP